MAIGLTKCTKVSDFGEYRRSLNISHNSLHLKTKIPSGSDKIIVNSSYIPTKFFDIIKENLTTVTLTEKEFLKYKYQPKRYCYEKLGSIEIWGLLLRINNMSSCVQFNTRTFKIPNKNIFSLLNEMMIHQSDIIDKNNESLGI